jgi:hypothetical protein
MRTGFESLIHRDYAVLLAAIPAIAAGAIAAFVWRDRELVPAGPDPWLSRPPAPTSTSPAVAVALVGIVLAAMAERLENDPAAYPLLACAAARLAVPSPTSTAAFGWTGLTERAHRAAVDVLRPTALSALVRAATLDQGPDSGPERESAW